MKPAEFNTLASTMLRRIMVGVFLVSCFVAASTIFINITQKQKELADSTEKSTQLISEALAFSVWTIDDNAISNIAQRRMEDLNLFHLTVSDENGVIYSKTKNNQNFEKGYQSQKDIVWKGQKIAQVEVSVSGAVYRGVYIHTVVTSVVMTIALLICLALFFKIDISKSIKDRIDTILLGLENISSGNYLYRFMPAKESDINAIHQKINTMAASILYREHELENQHSRLSKLNTRMHELYEKNSSLEIIQTGLRIGCDVAGIQMATFHPIDGVAELSSLYHFEGRSIKNGELIEGRFERNGQSSQSIDIKIAGDVVGVYCFYTMAKMNDGVKQYLDSVIQMTGQALNHLLSTAEKIELKVSLDGAKNLSKTIQRTSQMLAHDVRKPLTLVQMLIETTENETDPHKIKKILNSFEFEIEVALEHADGLIEDVLEFGREVDVQKVSTSLRGLLGKAMNMVFRNQKAKEITIAYNLENNLMVDVDARRFIRVLINIIDNAAHAIGRTGEMWISTSTVNSKSGDSVRLTVGNSGPPISAAVKAKLFQPFFTSGKSHGTGLGLSIAQKIINAHNGTISCSSDSALGTEFHITLPIEEVIPDSSEIKLPTSVSDVNKAWKKAKETPGDSAIERIRLHEKEIVAAMVHNLDASNRTVQIVAVDDEQIFLDSLAAKMSDFKMLNSNINFKYFNEPDGALVAIAQSKPDLVITDFEMGADNISGLELIRRAKLASPDTCFYLFSSNTDPNNYKEVLKVGGDGFLPKPLSRFQLLSMLSHSIGLAVNSSNIAVALKSNKLKCEKRISDEKTIIVIDDDVFICEAWQNAVKDAKVVTFNSPQAFFEGIHKYEKYKNLFVVTDMYFDGIEQNGVGLAKELNESNKFIPIFLSTSGLVKLKADSPIIKVLKKKPYSYSDLLEMESGVAQKAV